MSTRPACDVCILVHDFGLGGSERIAIRLANAWSAEGRAVSILCGSAVGPLLALVGPHVSVIEVAPAIVRARGSRHRLGAKLAPLVDALAPALILVPGNFHVPLVAPLLAGLRGQRPQMVIKFSNPIRRDDRSSAGQWLFESGLRQRLRDADSIITMAPIFASEVRLTTGHPEVVAIPEPILSDDVVPPRPADPASTELVAAGRFVAQKDFRLAIEALALIPDQRVRLTIFGDGPERQSLQAAALRLGVSERLSLPGYIPELRPMLAHAQIFLLPSLFEGYPAVAVEALAAGVPVVATDCSPAIRDIISHAELGTVVGARTPQAMAHAIQQRLQAPPPDPNHLAASVARHRIGPIAAEYLKLFDRLALQSSCDEPVRRQPPALLDSNPSGRPA